MSDARHVRAHVRLLGNNQNVFPTPRKRPFNCRIRNEKGDEKGIAKHRSTRSAQSTNTCQSIIVIVSNLILLAFSSLHLLLFRSILLDC